MEFVLGNMPKTMGKYGIKRVGETLLGLDYANYYLDYKILTF